MEAGTEQIPPTLMTPAPALSPTTGGKGQAQDHHSPVPSFSHLQFVQNLKPKEQVSFILLGFHVHPSSEEMQGPY